MPNWAAALPHPYGLLGALPLDHSHFVNHPESIWIRPRFPRGFSSRFGSLRNSVAEIPKISAIQQD